MSTIEAQSLFLHIKNQDAAAVRNRLKDNVINLDERDRNGQTFLMVASQVGSAEIIHLLLDSPTVDVNAVDNDNWSALLNAAKEGHVDSLVLLCEADADLEHKDMGGWTALMWACYKGRTEVVRELLSREANSNVRGEHNMSCLCWAAGRGFTEIVRLLVLHEAQVNTADKYGTTPLMWAARKGYHEIVEFLLEHDATLDNAGMNSWTALIMASKGGYIDVVESLLEYSHNINAVDKDSYTALTHAAKEGYVEIVDLLLEKGAYVNRPDRYGDTILIHATKGGHLEVVKALVRKHADIDIQGVDEKTAAYWAVDKGHIAIMKLLLDYNAGMEVNSKGGDTLLLKAVRSRNLEIATILLEKGAKASATDKRGDTALHISVRGRSKRLTELLLRNPKDGRLLYRPNKSGETPYQLDAEHEKRILTQVFGTRNLNADDNIEGYDLYSSTIADVLSEPSLTTPMTVGLYAKWGSGKSFLIKKLVKEMKNFTRHNAEPLFRFSGLQFAVSFFPSLILGVILALAFDWKIGLGVGLGVLALQYIFLAIMWVGSVKKDWTWADYLSTVISKKLQHLKLLLQVMFCNEPTVTNRDTAAVKFVFTDNARLASVVGEKSIAAMISTLCEALEKEYGTIVTRLYKVLKPEKASEQGKFKCLCCVPYFLIVVFIMCCIITEACLIYFYEFKNLFDKEINTVDGVVIGFLVVIGLALLGNVYTWSCMIIGLALPASKRVQKIISHSDSLRMEGLMQNLKKEVELLGQLTTCMDAFLHKHTRLVVIVDGLDSCEQEKLLQVLDTVHMLFSDDKSPFVTILAVDPHVIIKGIEHNLQGLFRDSSINGHDYLRNLVQLPFFLQSQTMPRSRYSIAKTDRSEGGASVHATASTGGVSRELSTERDVGVNHVSSATAIYHKQDSTVSALSSVSIPELNKLSNKKKRSPGEGATGYLSSTNLIKHSSQMDLSKSLNKSSYFSDVNPRNMKRLMNIIAVTGRLLRACNVEFNWYKLASWINITEQWPYRLSWTILEVEGDEIQDSVTLKAVYDMVVPKLPPSKEVDPQLEIDRDERKLEVFLSSHKPMLTVGDLRRFMPCTINVDPYLRKLIKEQLQNAENLAYEYSMYGAPSTVDQLGWPYPYRRPQSRLELTSPRATPTRPSSAMRVGMLPPPSMMPAPNALPMPQQGMVSPYGMYGPMMPAMYSPLPTNLSPSPATMTAAPRASPRVALQGGFPAESLMAMTVDDICNLLPKLDGLHKAKLSIYMQCLKENNITGPVLLTCDLTELKPVLMMSFGDWELFRSLVQTLREREITFDSMRNQDANNCVEEYQEGVQSPSLKFTQNMPLFDSRVQVPQPSYPMARMNIRSKKNLSDMYRKTKDKNSDISRSKSTGNIKKMQNQGGKFGVNQLPTIQQQQIYNMDYMNAPQQSKMTRKDSFVSEVMMESDAIASFVEACGVVTDIGEETDEEVLRGVSPIPEERLTQKRKRSIKSADSKTELSKSKQKEEDPRYKLGDSDSDSEEVELLARKSSDSRKTTPSSVHKKLSAKESITASTDSLSCKESSTYNSSKMSKSSSKDTLKSYVDHVSETGSPRKAKHSDSVTEADTAPLLGNKDDTPNQKTGFRFSLKKSKSKEIDVSIPQDEDLKSNPGNAPLSANSEVEKTLSDYIPATSSEHLALRLLSHTDETSAPSAFKSVTPTSSRASSRASSLGLSLVSYSKGVSREESLDGVRLSTSETYDSGPDASRRSSKKLSPLHMSDDVSVDIEQSADGSTMYVDGSGRTTITAPDDVLL